MKTRKAACTPAIITVCHVISCRMLRIFQSYFYYLNISLHTLGIFAGWTFSCSPPRFIIQNISKYKYLFFGILFSLNHLDSTPMHTLLSPTPAWERFTTNLDILTTPDLLGAWGVSWESFIIRLDILNERSRGVREWLRIFHYSPWYTYAPKQCVQVAVENLSLFTLIYLLLCIWRAVHRWESFIIRLDILSDRGYRSSCRLRIFHYSPWYTYKKGYPRARPLRIFHYSPWYTYTRL